MMSVKGGYVLKPVMKPKLGKREIEFYESLQQPSDSTTKELKTYLPGYFGTTELWMQGQSVQWLVLEDLCRNFKEPCIMDVKIGRQTWDPNAPLEKIQAEKVRLVVNSDFLIISFSPSQSGEIFINLPKNIFFPMA